MKTSIVAHLEANNLMCKAQHGFLKKRSTTTNLMELMGDLVENFNKKASSIVAYVDFKKAFDKVSITKLLHKIKNMGIGGKLLCCLASLLENRSQRVKVAGNLSESKHVSSGVPQGSVLGPVLFLIYINDLPASLPAAVTPKIFADDFKCYAKITSSEDLQNFSLAMDRITDWAQCWQLPVASDKCSLMLFSKTMQLAGGKNLSLDQTQLQPLSKILDLGVTFEPDLKFKTHINLVCVKAKQKLYFMRKRILSVNDDLLITIYKMYVLPILMYCSPVWSPQTHDDILKLEKIQKKFTKSLPGYRERSVVQR